MSENHCFLYFSHFFIVSGRRSDPIPVIASWPEMDLSHCSYSYSILSLDLDIKTPSTPVSLGKDPSTSYASNDILKRDSDLFAWLKPSIWYHEASCITHIAVNIKHVYRNTFNYVLFAHVLKPQS